MYIFVKGWYVICSFVKQRFYKFIFGRNLSFGHHVVFRRSFTLVAEGRVNIHDNVFFNHNCSVCSMESIEIGEGTICGENVKIYDHNHEYRDIRIPIKEQGYHSAPIRIGKHCWIASNVVILQGVTIGDNCVIGAGCVIYKDIEKNSVVVNKQDLLIQNLK